MNNGGKDKYPIKFHKLDRGGALPPPATNFKEWDFTKAHVRDDRTRISKKAQKLVHRTYYKTIWIVHNHYADGWFYCDGSHYDDYMKCMACDKIAPLEMSKRLIKLRKLQMQFDL